MAICLVSLTVLATNECFCRRFHFLNKINHFEAIWNDSKVR